MAVDPALPISSIKPTWSARRLPSVSRSIQFLAVLVFVVIVGVTFRQMAALRATSLADSHRQMAGLTMVLAEQTGRAVDTIDLILRGLIEPIQQTAQAPPLTSNTLRRRLAGIRQLLAIEIVSASGQTRVSSREPAGQPTQPAILAALQRHAADRAEGMLISQPARQMDGSWTAFLTRRIDDASGHFDAIAVAWLNLAYFEDFYKSVGLNDDGAIILHRRDGVVLAQYPHAEHLEGTSFADQPPFKDVLAHAAAETLEIDSTLDHGRRIVAIRALRSAPLAVNVSVDRDRVLATWREQAWTFTFAAGGFGLMIAALMFQLARRSREADALLVQSQTAHEAAEEANRGLLVELEERQRAEAALRQSQRMEAVGQLTGGVAHDFNNLLTILLGNIELMQANTASAIFAGRLNAMRLAAERGAKLTGHLLAFARRQPLVPRAVDLGLLIHGMEPLLASALGSQIALELDLDDTVPPTHVDPAQIELVILNLAMNARDAMPNGGKLLLQTRLHMLPASKNSDAPAAGAYLRLRVTDTGTGMTQDELSRAFEPYFTTKKTGSGSGLGLSQVYGVVRQSGGLVHIESVPGAGTTVEVSLPPALQTAVAPKPTTQTLGVVKPGQANVLVVDDDLAVRTTTAMLLRRLGYVVTEASGAEEALAILSGPAEIELMLSDVVMPEVNGPELARAAIILRPDLPIVFFSGYADPASIAGSIPFSKLLRKPFRPADLVQLIETTLAASRAPTEPSSNAGAVQQPA